MSAESTGEAKRPSPEHRRLEQGEQAWYCREHAHVMLPDEGTVLSPTDFRRLMLGDS